MGLKDNASFKRVPKSSGYFTVTKTGPIRVSTLRNGSFLFKSVVTLISLEKTMEDP